MTGRAIATSSPSRQLPEGCSRKRRETQRLACLFVALKMRDMCFKIERQCSPCNGYEQHVSALATLTQRNLNTPVLLPALCRLIRSRRLLLAESLHEHVDVTERATFPEVV